MSIAEKFEVIADEVYEKGKETENRAWWDCVTTDNTKTTYDRCFYNMDFTKVKGGWNPPYTLKPVYAVNLCSYTSGITKVTKEQIDFAGNRSCNYAFSNCYDLVEIEEIKINSSDGMYLFAECRKLETIGKIILKDSISNSPPFINCDSLKNITFEGVLSSSVSFQWSPLLTNESIENIISVLSDSSSGQTITYNTAAKTTYYNAHSAEYTDADTAWNALCATKSNWSISLV